MESYKKITASLAGCDGDWNPEENPLQMEQVFRVINDRGFGIKHTSMSFGKDTVYHDVMLFHEKQPITFYGESYKSKELAFKEAFMKLWKNSYI